MPLIKSCSSKNKSKNIRELVKSGKPRKQAVAIAYSVCKELKKQRS